MHYVSVYSGSVVADAICFSAQWFSYGRCSGEEGKPVNTDPFVLVHSGSVMADALCFIVQWFSDG